MSARRGAARAPRAGANAAPCTTKSRPPNSASMRWKTLPRIWRSSVTSQGESSGSLQPPELPDVLFEPLASGRSPPAARRRAPPLGRWPTKSTLVGYADYQPLLALFNQSSRTPLIRVHRKFAPRTQAGSPDPGYTSPQDLTGERWKGEILREETAGESAATERPRVGIPYPREPRPLLLPFPFPLPLPTEARCRATCATHRRTPAARPRFPWKREPLPDRVSFAWPWELPLPVPLPPPRMRMDRGRPRTRRGRCHRRGRACASW